MKADKLQLLADCIEESFGNKRNALKSFNKVADKSLSLAKLNELTDQYEILENAFKLGKDARKSFVDSKAIESIEKGDSRVLIEQMKQDKTRDNLTREKVACELYKRCDSFSAFAKAFINIYGGNEAGARRLMDNAIKKYSLESIKDRKAREISEFENSLTAKLGKGELTEKELLIEMLQRATAIAENGSESNKVMAIRSITQLHERLTAVKEKEDAENKEPLTLRELSLRMDEIIFGIPPEKILQIEQQQSYIN